MWEKFFNDEFVTQSFIMLLSDSKFVLFLFRGGYYTTLARKGLRIISLNMNYCNNMNWWLMINNKDPAGQLQWMIGVLEQAEKDNEKVGTVSTFFCFVTQANTWMQSPHCNGKHVFRGIYEEHCGMQYY